MLDKNREAFNRINAAGLPLCWCWGDAALEPVDAAPPRMERYQVQCPDCRARGPVGDTPWQAAHAWEQVRSGLSPDGGDAPEPSP